MSKFKIPADVNVWFTSDYHLYHENVLRFDGRPFNTVEEMHRVMILNHNSIVKPDDIVFNLGDASFCFRGKDSELKDTLSQFNGNIIYIPGNHETHLHVIKDVWNVCENQIVEVYSRKYDQNIVLCHYPIRCWNGAHYGSWHLHGHVHGGCQDDTGQFLNHDKRLKMMDVGVMNNENYRPFSLEEIKDFMSTCSDNYVPHHNLKAFPKG